MFCCPGVVQNYYDRVNDYMNLVPPMRLFLVSLVLALACVCFMGSSIRVHSEMAKLKAGISEMEMSLEEAASERVSESISDMDERMDENASTLSEKLRQQNARLASLVSENSQVNCHLSAVFL